MGKRGPKKGQGGRPRLPDNPLREYWRLRKMHSNQAITKIQQVMVGSPKPRRRKK